MKLFVKTLFLIILPNIILNDENLKCLIYFSEEFTFYNLKQLYTLKDEVR